MYITTILYGVTSTPSTTFPRIWSTMSPVTLLSLPGPIITHTTPDVGTPQTCAHCRLVLIAHCFHLLLTLNCLCYWLSFSKANLFLDHLDFWFCVCLWICLLLWIHWHLHQKPCALMTRGLDLNSYDIFQNWRLKWSAKGLVTHDHSIISLAKKKKIDGCCCARYN